MVDNRSHIVWSRAAEEDLLDIWRYLATEASPDIADRQLRAINDAIVRLSAWPEAGRKRDEIRLGLRSALVYPHTIFYRPAPAALEIVRVLHGARNVEAIFSSGSRRWEDDPPNERQAA